MNTSTPLSFCSHPVVVSMNGTKLYPLGKMYIPVCIPMHLRLGCHEYDNKLHIYLNILGNLLSWITCQGLGILPDHYPKPVSYHKEVNRINYQNRVDNSGTSVNTFL